MSTILLLKRGTILLFAVIFALCLGLGVNQYRMSARLAAVERHNERLLGYSRSLRHELVNAKNATKELWQMVPPPPALCPVGYGPRTSVRWEVFDEPEPRIGFKRPGE